MELLERAELLATLSTALRHATAGTGSVAVVEGEAGVGKTSLVRALADTVIERVLWGACDALSTPRPLGPLLDMTALGGASRAAEALAAGQPSHGVFDAFLADLTDPALVVIEDGHWADEATLDLLRFIGRRIRTTRALLVVTLREDEVQAGHPLRAVLGDLATVTATRLRVGPLSLDGVRQLAAEQPIDAERLHAATGGNPFYVTEVLAAPGWTVPPSVRDAVEARAARLPAATRQALEAVAVHPGGVERSLLRSLGVDESAMADALDARMLVETPTQLRFRHELARLGVEAGISRQRRRQLNQRALAALEEAGSSDAARLAHHASESGDPAAELRWRLEAARQAAAAGAFREAAAQYERAAAHAGLLDPAAEAELFSGYADVLIIVDHPARAVDAWRRVVALREAANDPVLVGVARAQYARALWTAGHADEAYRQVAAATAVADEHPDPRLAIAFAQRSYLAMLARRSAESVEWAERAVHTAAPDAAESVAMALNAKGAARIVGFDDVGGIEDLLRSRELAERAGSRRLIAAAFTNLGSGLGEVRRYPEAERFLQEGIAYAIAQDQDFTRRYSTAWLARVRFEQGRWDEAEELAAQAIAGEEISPISPMVALTVQGRVRTRRGMATADEPLAAAWQMAQRTGDLQRLWPSLAALSERAWLEGRPATDLAATLKSVFDLARDKALPWAIGELAFWQWRLGLAEPDLDGAAEPFAAHVRGDHPAAAAGWRALGCPYEEAWAQADSGSEPEMRGALDALIGLGAQPLADRVRRQLRAAGASGIPHGPRPSTASSAAGLTRREREVLALLANGLTDRQIAERLFVSPKTAGHHVSAILGKLGVRTRTEAATTALGMGLLDAENGEPSR